MTGQQHRAQRQVEVVSVSVENGYACRLELIDRSPAVVGKPSPPHRGQRVYVAYYSQAVLTNGWEPYDQPSPAAYLPLSYEQFVRERISGAGEVLVQRIPDAEDKQATAVSRRQIETSFQAAIVAAFRRAGAPPTAAARATRLLLRVRREQVAAA